MASSRLDASVEVTTALETADGIVFAPSNPFVSIEPILAIAGVRDAIRRKPAIAVSPIVGGEAIKGPAAKMMLELGLDVSPAGVAKRYAGIVGGFVMDAVDASLAPDVAQTGLAVRTAQSIMRTDEDRASLARVCLDMLGEVSAAD